MHDMNTAFRSAGITVFERGWLSSNNILFSSADAVECVLVDSGYATHAQQTLGLVRAALQGRPLHRIINTHLHSDHCGGNHALQEVYGCHIDVPAGEANKVDAWDEEQLSYRATGQHCPRFSRQGCVMDGDELVLAGHPWQVLASPGHDPESVLLYQPDLKLLISADALWENGFGVVFPELEGIAAFNDVAMTLDRIAALDIDWVIPGHGAPFEDVGAALDRARRRLQNHIDTPLRHAQYSVKALVKFHLLEVQVQSHSSLLAWMAATPLLQRVHATYFPELPFTVWSEEILGALYKSGAARKDGENIYND